MVLGKKVGIKQQLQVEPQSTKVKAAHLKNGPLTKAFREGKLAATDVIDSATGSTSSGSTRHNAARTLTRALENECNAPPLYVTQAPLWDEFENQAKLGDLAFMPVHETLYHVSLKHNEEACCSTSSAQKGFARDIENWKKRVQDHSDTAIAGIALWGDSAVSFVHDSLYLLTWMFLTGSLLQRFWIVCVSKRTLCQCGCYGRCTFEVIWSVLRWSFKALLEGRFPRTDHNNKPFTDPWRKRMAGRRLPFRAACIAKCGDWAWHKQILNLTGWRGQGPNMRICWLCGAGKRGILNAWDYSLEAPWRQSMIDMPRFWCQAAFEGIFVSGFWGIPGVVISYCRPDWMHTVDLGVLLYLLGNLFWEIFKELGGTFDAPGDAIAMLRNMLRTASHQLGKEPPIFRLTVLMFRKRANAKPRLCCKAAEARHVLPVMCHMLLNFFDYTTQHAALRYQCSKHLLDCFELLDNWVDGTSQRKLGEHGRKHLLLWKELRNEATDDNMWAEYPKHHLMLHIVEHARVNPKAEWNYGDENEIGKAAQLHTQCNVRYSNTTCMQKYRAMLVVE